MARYTDLPEGTEFVLWFKGGSEGCDYTISCNETVDPLKAKKIEKAAEEAEKLVLERGYYCRSGDGEGPVNSDARAVVFRVSERCDIDLESLFAKVDEKKRRAAKRDEDAREAAEYERLKKKFGKK